MVPTNPLNTRPWAGPLIAGLLSAALVLSLNRFLPLLDQEARWLAGAVSWLVVFATLALSALYRRAGYAVVAGVLAFGGLQRYVQSMGIREPNVLITDLLETDLRELAGFVDIKLFGIVVIGALTTWLTLRLLVLSFPHSLALSHERQRKRNAWIVVALIGTLAVGGLFVPKPKIEEAQERVFQAAGWPYIPFAQSLRIVKGYWFGEKQFAHLIDGLPAATAFPSTFEPHPEGLTVVFVFGESVRADHWGLNGYRRDTTPRLRAEHNVINFPDTLTFGTYTQVSAVGMMTPASFDHPMPQAGSFVDLFAEHGFDLGAFISSRPTSIQLRLIRPINEHVQERGLADLLLPKLRDFVSRPSNKNKFAFVYTEGNHFPYVRDYPPRFARFKPDDHGRADLPAEIEKLTNAYDNAVGYTDWFLSEIIDMLRSRRAILIYVADHGDALGDEGNFIRGGTFVSAYLRKVPFVIWVSDTFARSDPDKVRQLREHAAMKVSHEYLFSTVLGLAGIETGLATPELDLGSPSAQPRTHEASDGAPMNSPFHSKR